MFVADPVNYPLTDIESDSIQTAPVPGRRDAGSGIRQALLLSNDLTGRGDVAEALDSAGCKVTRADTTSDALERIRGDAFHIIVIDIRPDLLGYEALCALRAARVTLPLLFVSARSTPEAFQLALSLGADDVGVLPFDNHTISSRIGGLIERGPCAPGRGLRIGPLELNLDSRRASVGVHLLRLTEAEFAVVELLATRNGAPVALERILYQVRDLLQHPAKRTVEDLVARIRRKLAPFRLHIVLVNVRGLGFALRTPAALHDA
jgi:DNA-binding response OmpR family regulator